MEISTKELFDLKDKLAIVTGGAGLIGQELCKALSDFGAKVVIADIDINKAKEVKEEIGNKNIYTKQVDISDQKSVQKVIDDIINQFGEINILVNNAYPRNDNFGNKYEEVKIDDWRENIDLNLNSYFLVTKLVSEKMMEQKEGNIINLGSIYGIQGPDFNIYKNLDMSNPVEYSAIKGGILNLTKYLASYLAKYNIRVNSISPGGVFDNQDPEFVDNYNKRVPLGRMANADEIRGAVVYLASEASSYVTGHNLVIDGGWTIC